jgi:phospholipid-binding lipoprotein MlaA
VTMNHWRRTACAFASALIMFSTAPAPVRAQGESELATQTQSPVVDLISVPLQNINFGVGRMDDVPPNSQAVISFRLTDECTVITRTTALLPSKSDAIIGGASAIRQGPTATDDALGTWGVLPTVLALTVPGPGAVRALANNVGSFSGAGPRKDVNQILIQPLVNYDLASDCHLNSVPIVTADWKADADDRWTLPADATLLDRPAPAASAPRSVVPPAAGEPEELEDYDPWEAFNAKAFEFNRRMDKYALKPVAMGWKTVVPQPAGIMISNAFDNLNVVPRVVNNLLQGKWDGAGREVSRFLINSTAGMGGLFDPAKDVYHITKSPADFGQTLGKWGIGPGPYLVLPFMEPLTVRDGIGKVIDRAIDPVTYVVPLIPALSLMAGNRVNERALNYELFAAFDDDVIDAYSAVRNGYLRLRERRINE